MALSPQAPSAVILVRPHYFSPNPATAADNLFQRVSQGPTPEGAASAAYAEVTELADRLTDQGVIVHDSFPTATADVVVREETSNTAEIGVKSSFLDRRLTFNLSAFHTKFDNFQVQSFDPNLATFLVQNAAAVTSKGIEASVIAAPFEGLTINSSLSLLSSKFGQFLGAQCYPTQTTMGCSSTVSTFDASGLRLPAAPKFTSTMQVHYEVPTDGNVRPFIQGNWYHRSSINYVVNQAPGAGLGAIDIFGASIGAKIGDQLRISLFCKNCTNKINPTAIGIDSGDANSRNARGAATPKLSYTQHFGLDTVRSFGLNLGFDF